MSELVTRDLRGVVEGERRKIRFATNSRKTMSVCLLVLQSTYSSSWLRWDFWFLVFGLLEPRQIVWRQIQIVFSSTTCLLLVIVDQIRVTVVMVIAEGEVVVMP